LQWLLTIASLGIVTAALVVALGQKHGAPVTPKSTTTVVDTPVTLSSQQLAVVEDTPARGWTMPKVVVSKRPVWDTTMTDAKPQYGGAPISLPPVRTLTFRVSELHYGDNTDLDSAVAHDPRLGAEWQVADWNDLLEYSSSHPIQDVIDSLYWEMGLTNQLWLRKNGRRTLPRDPLRYFFITRLDHLVWANYLVHAQIDNNHVVLGSWHGMDLRILAVQRQ
jgi:hypothetical protein